MHRTPVEELDPILRVPPRVHLRYLPALAQGPQGLYRTHGAAIDLVVYQVVGVRADEDVV